MKKTIAKHYYELCEHAYEETEQRKAFVYPDWLIALRNEKKTAQNSYVGLEAAILMVSHNESGLANLYPGLQTNDQVNHAELFATWGALIAMNDVDEPFKPLKSAFLSLSEYAKFVHSNFRTHDSSESSTSKSLHEVVTEACEREAARVTPCDVTEVMLVQLREQQSVDVFAQDGLGVFYAVRDRIDANLVGEDFGVGEDRICPASLKSINRDCQTWYQNAEFTNKQFLDFEWACGTPNRRSKALLVNASKVDVPFVGKDEKVKRQPGSLNACLDAGYEKVVVLVSNHYLTAGRGIAEEILKYCLSKGLRQIIQLPMGVIGFKSHQHSILVFENGANTDKVTFEDLSDEANTRNARRGFGQPRRAKELKQNGDGFWGLEYITRKTDISVGQLMEGGAKAKRLLSFEAGQFISRTVDPFEQLREKYNFVKLQEFMEVFRAHHIEELGESNRITYQEVGASGISELGWIDAGRERECGVLALDKRRAQVLRDKDIVLCFRGAPDSFGKAGIYRKKSGEVAIPNQSFVVLRLKESVGAGGPTPEMVLSWLRTRFAQNYLRQKSISPDVVRVAPKDIAAMEMPSGPEALMDVKLIELEKIHGIVAEIQGLRKKVLELEGALWFEVGLSKH